MAHLIDKDVLTEKLWERRTKHCDFGGSPHSEYGHEDDEILSLINTLEVKDLPIWEKVSPDTGQTTLYKDEGKSYLERFGYRIDLEDLDKLPKKNLKAQKGE